MAPVRIIGSYISPYVRKVLVALDVKGVAYEIDPIVPFHGGERFTALSPLRRIPVLVDDTVTLADSTAICEYLEERHPEPALLPEGAARRARSRWLEEFADTRMGDVFIWRLFDQVAINPFVWSIPTDEAVLRETLGVEVPSVLDYLESQLPEEGFLFDALSIADVAIASFFRNAAFALFRVDPERWPRTAAFVNRVLALPAFTRLVPFEESMLRTPFARQREVLAGLGAPLCAETVGGEPPRRGIMRSG